MVYGDTPPEPSTEYEDKSLGTWSTAAQVNTFFTEHTYANGWAGLKIGNYITFDSKQWVIAGFNTETARDGIAGGIVFIPRYTNYTTDNWNMSSTEHVPYLNSDICEDTISRIYTYLSTTIIGSHMVERNVTLGSKIATSGSTTSATINTTAYLTLMSYGQLSGTFASNTNSYDDGEANYKLPLFNFIDIITYAGGSDFWLRNLYGYNTSSLPLQGAYYINSSGSIAMDQTSNNKGVRPLIYLR